MGKRFTWIIVLVLLANQLALKAEEPPILTNLRGKYLTARSGIETEFTAKRNTLKSGYLSALTKYEGELQRSGNLDGLISVKKDREAFEKSGEAGSGGTEKQQSLRKIYLDALAPINRDETQKLNDLKVSYSKALESMVSDLTKSNIIEAALLAKAELKKIQGEIESDPPVETLTTSAPTEIPGHLKFRPIPLIDPPITDKDLWESGDNWPQNVTVPKGDHRFSNKIETKEKSSQIKFLPGTTLKGKGESSRIIFGNGTTTVGTEIQFSDFKFNGNLNTEFFFTDCTFQNVDIGKGGGWFGGKFMSRWQLRDCKFHNHFEEKWESHLTGVQIINSTFERVDFPSIIYHEDHEPSDWANEEWAVFYQCQFRKCEIPISVLSIMQDCSFDNCRFFMDEPEISFAKKVERTIHERDSVWKVKTLPENFVVNKLPLQ
ncbi:MAG: hypothetical protein P1U89_23045 [Verrucomicrobiales bacterium]|nr:hypothetical protein [Verrucomicrobiales bacterium]